MINHVAREILFGKYLDALQEDIQQAKEELPDLELWRKKSYIINACEKTYTPRERVCVFERPLHWKT